jgi:hypothetical protein
MAALGRQQAYRMRTTIGYLAKRTFGVGLALLLLSGCEVMRAASDDLASLGSPKQSPPAAPVPKVTPAPQPAIPAARPVKPTAAADVAVAPAPAVEAPTPVLTGYRESELRALLGPPTSEEAHSPGKQWRYRIGTCTLDIQLYPDVETKQYGTLAYKVKSDDNTDEGRRLCLAQLQSRLQAGR